MQGNRGDEVVAPGEGNWDDLLSGFVDDYKGAPLSVRVVEADGSSRRFDGCQSELRLMSIAASRQGSGCSVVLFAHKHPGAEITQIEFSGAVDLRQQERGLSVHAADGCRLEVQVSGTIPS